MKSRHCVKFTGHRRWQHPSWEGVLFYGLVCCYSKRGEKNKKQSRGIFEYFVLWVEVHWLRGGGRLWHVWPVQSAVIDWRSPDASFVSLLFLLLTSFSFSPLPTRRVGGASAPPMYKPLS